MNMKLTVYITNGIELMYNFFIHSYKNKMLLTLDSHVHFNLTSY